MHNAAGGIHMSKAIARRVAGFVIAATLEALVSTGARTARAQPADAQVRADITGRQTIGVTLSSKPGTKQWNRDLGVWEWVRGALCTLRTEEPAVTLIVKGDAVYTLDGARASYRRFRVISNEYIGMPTPTVDSLMAIIRANPGELFGNSTWMRMVDAVERLEVIPSDSTPWTWHTLNSVEFMVATRYRVITSYTVISTVEVNYSVRIYRESIEAPWKRAFVSTPRERLVVGTTTHSAAEIRSMTTLGSAAAADSRAR
jgi:hypothetical protein